MEVDVDEEKENSKKSPVLVDAKGREKLIRYASDPSHLVEATTKPKNQFSTKLIKPSIFAIYQNCMT